MNEWINQILSYRIITKQELDLLYLNTGLSYAYEMVQVREHGLRVFQEGEVERLQKEIAQLKFDAEKGWNNPRNWPSITSRHKTIYGFKVPPNTFINDNDKVIRSVMLPKRTGDIRTDARKVMIYLANYRLRYINEEQNSFHPGEVEYFEGTSLAWHIRKVDCDGFANCFAGIMRMMGYKTEVIVCLSYEGSGVIWNGKEIGHAYNMVEIDGEFEVFDANQYQAKATANYPQLEEVDEFYNYYGVYSLKK